MSSIDHLEIFSSYAEMSLALPELMILDFSCNAAIMNLVIVISDAYYFVTYYSYTIKMSITYYALLIMRYVLPSFLPTVFLLTASLRGRLRPSIMPTFTQDHSQRAGCGAVRCIVAMAKASQGGDEISEKVESLITYLKQKK